MLYSVFKLEGSSSTSMSKILHIGWVGVTGEWKERRGENFYNSIYIDVEIISLFHSSERFNSFELHENAEWSLELESSLLAINFVDIICYISTFILHTHTTTSSLNL